MVIIFYTAIVLLQISLAAFITFLCIAFITGGPFVPSTPKAVESMVTLAHIRPGDTIYDMGSGDGRLLFAAAAHGARAVGIEINPHLVWYTRLRVFFSPYRRKISVLWKNMWNVDVSKADVLFVYLVPWRMDEFTAKLDRELRPNTTVVSNSFMFPKWKLRHKDEQAHIFVYKTS